MSVRSLNKVQLIGNLTRDPELRYTPAGTAVCSFGLATNRSWTTDAGEKKEETEFHRIVSWNKLAELCSQLLVKGRKVYVEGRLQTRSWQGQDGAQRQTTEIVIDDMIILDSRRDFEARTSGEEFTSPVPVASPAMPAAAPAAPPAVQAAADTTGAASPDTGKTDDKPAPLEDKKKKKTGKTAATAEPETKAVAPTEEINPDDIPF